MTLLGSASLTTGTFTVGSGATFNYDGEEVVLGQDFVVKVLISARPSTTIPGTYNVAYSFQIPDPPVCTADLVNDHHHVSW